jgi:peptidoglycan/LPS O-acetylase OafA/YrhL
VSRLDQFVLGMLAAAAYSGLRRAGLAERAARVAPYALAAAIALLVVAFRLEGALYLSPGGSWPYALMSLATAAIVLAACASEGRAARWIAPAPLRALGVVSYGVFLYHQLALGVVGARAPLAAGEPTWGRMGWTLALSLAASALAGLASWRLVERPLLR